MPDNEIPSIYVRPDNKAVIICIHCNRQKVIDADSFIGHQRNLEVTCICQNVSIVNLEFRNQPRRKKSLRGTYINHSQKDCVGSFSILNVSLTGMGFTSQDAENFNEDDKLTVKFTLDDEQKTEISKVAIVKYINQQSIGCEFEEKEEPFTSPLGNYVMSD